ncbi:MAG: hypothetical protein ACK4HQ_08025, partial [Brevinematales bacterium]
WQEAAQTISELCRPDAEIIVGVNIDESLKDAIRVVIIATDFQQEQPQSEINEGISAEEIFSDRRLVKIDEAKGVRRFRTYQSGLNAQQQAQAVGDDDLNTPAYLRVQRRFKP